MALLGPLLHVVFPLRSGRLVVRVEVFFVIQILIIFITRYRTKVRIAVRELYVIAIRVLFNIFSEHFAQLLLVELSLHVRCQIPFSSRAFIIFVSQVVLDVGSILVDDSSLPLGFSTGVIFTDFLELLATCEELYTVFRLA